MRALMALGLALGWVASGCAASDPVEGCAAGETQRCTCEGGDTGVSACDPTTGAFGACATECIGGTAPAEETCDGLDGDCDAVVDEGLTCT